MSGGTWALGGGVVGAVTILPLVLTAALAGNQTNQQQPVGGGGLNAARVPPQYVALVEAAGRICPEITAPLIAAQIEAESTWRPNAVSPQGAQGISQFMPATWAQYGNGGDPFNPADAIPAQGRYMCDLASQVNAGRKSGRITKGTTEQNALAGYNAGMGRVYRAGGFPVGIAEPDNYVPRILAFKAKYTAAGGVPGSAGAAAAVEVAKRYLGYPYVWGGGDLNGPTGYLDTAGPPVGFDCSGLTRFAMYQATKVDIGAGTVGQIDSPTLRTVLTRSAGSPLPLAQMAPGDVVLLNIHGWGHVALYAGNGEFIHAPQTGDVIKIVPGTRWTNIDWIVRRLP